MMTNAENYELGRGDERVALEELLDDVEIVLSTLQIGYVPEQVEKLLEAVRQYRQGTQAIIAAFKQRGWYPK